MGLAILGICTLLVVITDFLLTTVAITDRKLPSRWISRGSWQALRRLLPHTSGGRTVIGPLVMSSIGAFWIVSTALSWLLIFQASQYAVVYSDTGQPAGWLMDLGYVGEALSTLGGGNSQPGSAGWELTTVLVGVNGMIVLTLSVSFVLNTTQTVAAGRAFLAHSAASRDLAGEPASDLKPLADLVASLNSVPHALYYSSPDPALRLPEGLEQFAVNWLEHRGDLRGLRTILNGLPNFEVPDEADDQEFLTRLRDWSAGFTF
ncbi:hypothetical protein K3722_21280 (plasmid) [Leisingera caerulea]|uniref:Two pore domain potassium channel family protein n=1 Tax=Leisingera caerulea TaxID=506591 RepID=A0ABY5X372_LEICA|nr:hypothetical protein [Leisingera caerulea]UWQ60975.1 hypothetical protein K3722_21280 [Leisingera caerulea]